MLAFIRGDTSFFKPERIDLDPQGTASLSKKAYYGFMMEYEQHRQYKKGAVIGHYFEDKKLSAVKFHSGFGPAAYDRELKQKDLGKLQYFVKADGLYDAEGTLVFRKCGK